MTFNCIIFTGNDSLGNKGFITYHKVNNLNKFESFINAKFPNWRFYNVFNNSDKKFIECKLRKNQIN